jgi:hypothetical protein
LFASCVEVAAAVEIPTLEPAFIATVRVGKRCVAGAAFDPSVPGLRVKVRTAVGVFSCGAIAGADDAECADGGETSFWERRCDTFGAPIAARAVLVAREAPCTPTGAAHCAATEPPRQRFLTSPAVAAEAAAAAAAAVGGRTARQLEVHAAGVDPMAVDETPSTSPLDSGADDTRVDPTPVDPTPVDPTSPATFLGSVVLTEVQADGTPVGLSNVLLGLAATSTSQCHERPTYIPLGQHGTQLPSMAGTKLLDADDEHACLQACQDDAGCLAVSYAAALGRVTCVLSPSPLLGANVVWSNLATVDGNGVKPDAALHFTKSIPLHRLEAMANHVHDGKMLAQFCVEDISVCTPICLWRVQNHVRNTAARWRVCACVVVCVCACVRVCVFPFAYASVCVCVRALK